MSRIFAKSNEVVTEAVNTNSNTTLSNVGGVYYVGMGVTGTDIPDNTYVSATALGSNQVTISNTATGTTAITATFNKTNYNVPTNPKLTTFGAYTGSERLYTIIYEQPPDGSAETFIQQLQGSDSADTEYSNLETTEGFRIRSYDSTSGNGLQLNGLSLGGNNYFILIHSDDHLKHHFAKVTEFGTHDVDGDYIDFEPKLGNEIPKGTKYMVFKGPAVSDNTRNCKVLAVSAGIKVDLQNDLVCAKPLFYFFNDNLDKDNELDHNTKYFTKFIGANTSTVTPNVLNTFVTVQDSKYRIKDYSKYTMNVKMVDNLKDLDYPAYIENFANNPSALPQEYDSPDYTIFTTPNVFTDYNDCFPNARRDGDLDVHPLSDISYTGPKRYVHYDFSPTKANKLYNCIDVQMEESVGNRGSFAQIKAVDSKRILPQKVKTFDDLRVRHRLFKGKYNDWFPLKATMKAATSTTNEYTFTIQYDLGLAQLLNDGDEVKIGNRVFIIENIDARNLSGSTGIEQDVTFRQVNRLETESEFTSTSYTLNAGDVIYRRAWNTNDNTLLTDFDLIANRNNNLYVKFISKDFGFLEAEVTDSNVNRQTLTLSFPNTNRSITNLDYMDGSYYIEVEKFSGSIEKTSQYKDNGQTMIEFSGRSEVRKLLGPVINKNTLHSKDMIYSSIVPHIDLNNSGINITLASYGSDEITVASSPSLTTADAGKLVFAYTTAHDSYMFLGVLESVAGTTITLEENSLAEITGATAPTDSSIAYNYKLAYTESKQYSFNKALSANTKSDTVSTLSGASGKGLFFDGGYIISGTAETTKLAGSSSNTTNSKSVGYYLNAVRGINEASLSQARLSDGKTNTGTIQYTEEDVINSLLDFTVVNISRTNNSTVIELAPHIPLTLGRVDVNHANTIDTRLDTTNLGQVNASTVGNFYFTIPVSSSTNALSSISSPRKYHGQPVYASTDASSSTATKTYIGRFVQADLNEAGDTITIYINKQLETDIDNQYIRILTTQTDGETSHRTHEMNFLNGGHLHGGKQIILMSPTYGSGTSSRLGNIVPLNYTFFQGQITGEIGYADKYGSPHYRLFNIEKGNFNATTEVIATDSINRLYYGQTPSKIRYYANAYRGVGTTNDNQTPVRFGKTGLVSTNNHSLPESRGFTSVFGSNFFDRTLTKSGGSLPLAGLYKDPTDVSNSATGHNSPYTAKDNLKLIDPKVARMFLFANGDVTGYSSTRRDSLLFTIERSYSDYNLMLLKEPAITENSDDKENMFGSTKNINYTDADYSLHNITSCETTLKDLRRFSIMRLTEVCFDWAFNQIDPENAVTKDRTNSQWRYNGKFAESLSAVFSSGNVAVSNYISNAITCDNDPSSHIAAGKQIYDANGRYIGLVSGTSSTGSTPAFKIDLSDGPMKTNGNAFFAGTIYKANQGHTGSAFTTSSALITGHGKADTFVNFDKGNHFLKTMVARQVGSGGYGESGSTFDDNYDVDLGVGGGHSHRNPNLWLPVNFDVTSLIGNQSESVNWHSAEIFNILDKIRIESNTNDCSAEELIYKGMLPLFLDRFSVEDGDGAEASKGMVGQPIMGASLRKANVTNFQDISTISMKTQFDFAKWENNALKADTTDDDKDADGVLMAFKPRLYIEEDENFDISCNTNTTAGSGSTFGSNPKIIQMASGDTSSLEVGMKITGTPIPSNSVITQIDSSSLFRINNDVTSTSSPRTLTVDTKKTIIGNSSTFNYIIDADKEIAINSLLDGSTTAEGNINRKFLDFMDLTGCYLISEKGKYYNDEQTVASYSDIFITNPSLNEQTPNVIAYVISHTIDTTNSSERHIITTDTRLPNDFYRIMQPNHTCFYDFSPNEIRLNSASSKYTKINGENACYTDIKDYSLRDSAGERTLGTAIGTGATATHYNTGGQEAALSMYVLIDTEQVKGKAGLRVVTRDVTDSRKIVGHYTASADNGKGAKTSVVLSDGDDFFKSAMTFTDNDDDIGFFLTFEDMRELIGVVSVSEPFTITVEGDVEPSKRALIGTGVTICSEVDDLAEILLEENNIDFTTTSADYPIFVAPDLKGLDLYSALNSILTKKDKIIYYDNETFQIKNKDDSDFSTGTFIQDTGDVELYSYEKSENMFDLYNEITVYGKDKKATRRDIRSIDSIGRKTLEVYDETLITQKEVDDKAFDLLKLHNDFNEKIEIEVSHKKLSQLRAGDIVELEIARENIPRNKYLVLQIKHELIGSMKLELGRYSKKLEDRFSEIVIEQKKIRASQRSDRFDESSVINTFIEKAKIKPIRMIARERKSSGGLVFGFGATLNTNSRALGFGQSLGVTYTTLAEEEF